MAKRHKVKSSHSKIVRTYRNKCHKLAASSIEDALSEVKPDFQYWTLIEFAAESMSALAWMIEEDSEIKVAFERCRKTVLRSLKDRVDHSQTKLAAIEKQNITA
jgi:hypothetical protein